MTEEIKEILSELKNDYYIRPYEDVYSEYPIKTIDKKQTKRLLNYITNLQKENKQLKKSRDFHLRFNQSLMRRVDFYQSKNEKAVEYIKKDTRWFDSEYVKIYGMLCDCEGAKGDRLEVLVNPTNLLNILKGGDE